MVGPLPLSDLLSAFSSLWCLNVLTALCVVWMFWIARRLQKNRPRSWMFRILDRVRARGVQLSYIFSSVLQFPQITPIISLFALYVLIVWLFALFPLICSQIPYVYAIIRQHYKITYYFWQFPLEISYVYIIFILTFHFLTSILVFPIIYTFQIILYNTWIFWQFSILPDYSYYSGRSYYCLIILNIMVIISFIYHIRSSLYVI